MRAAIKRLLNGLAPTELAGSGLELATAVLLHEMARADFDRQPVEIERLRSELAAHFALSAPAVDALLGNAEVHAAQAVSLHTYIAALNARLTPADKRPLMLMLWRVACADGRVDANEEHLLRRLADLLHVPHRDFIAAKMAACSTLPGG